MIQQHCCENCQRSQMDIARYSMRGYVAYLCPTCAHVLVVEEKPERFIALCNRAADKQTNNEMKKIHALLSQFIMIGMLFVTVIAAAAVVQANTENHEITRLNEGEYLSFSVLNNY